MMYSQKVEVVRGNNISVDLEYGFFSPVIFVKQQDCIFLYSSKRLIQRVKTSKRGNFMTSLLTTVAKIRYCSALDK